MPGRITECRRSYILTALACAAVMILGTACTADHPATTKLTVLASSELADMQPLLDELRRDTGIELVLNSHRAQDPAVGLTPGDYHHDFAWLSSDRYFQLTLQASRFTGTRPVSTDIMSSPMAFGVWPATAEKLRRSTPGGTVSWADIADAAAAGWVRYGMADPDHSGSGRTALVGVATAAAGTGRALRPEDVTCDRLRGFYAGHTLTPETSTQLVDEFVANQDDTEGLVTDESVLLSLNASGRLREPLEIIYPEDGMVLSEYPLMLLNPDRRPEYDRVVGWLTAAATQKQIMERTHRRPIDPDVRRAPSLQTAIGNALYFPDQPEVIDKLLTNYDPSTRTQGRVIFLLDYSGSMRGERISALRAVFDEFSGADKSSTGRFVRFYQGEKFTLVRFGGTILAERDFTIAGQSDVDTMKAFLAADEFDGHTAVWSALDHAYQRASDLLATSPEQPVTIVLMTDGENNAEFGLDEFLRRHGALADATRTVHTYAIRYGEANPAELERAANATGGHLVDAAATSLEQAFTETRGCR